MNREKVIATLKDYLYSPTWSTFATNVMFVAESSKKLSVRRFMKYKTDPRLVDEASDESLFLLMSCLVNGAQEKYTELLKPLNAIISKNFTPAEIKLYSNYDEFNDDNFSELVIPHATQLAPDQYNAAISVYDLAMMRDSGKLYVDPNIQRELDTKKTSVDTLMSFVKIYPSKVKKIANAMIEDKYDYDEISINVMKDPLSDFVLELDDDGSTIVLPGNQEYIILDGNHRILAAQKAVQQSANPEWFKHRYFPVKLTNYSLSRCKEVLNQKWQATPVQKRRVEEMKRDNATLLLDLMLNSDVSEPAWTKLITKSSKEMQIGTAAFAYTDIAAAFRKHIPQINDKTRTAISRMSLEAIYAWNEYFEDNRLDVLSLKKTDKQALLIELVTLIANQM